MDQKKEKEKENETQTPSSFYTRFIGLTAGAIEAKRRYFDYCCRF